MLLIISTGLTNPLINLNQNRTRIDVNVGFTSLCITIEFAWLVFYAMMRSSLASKLPSRIFIEVSSNFS